MAKDYQRLWKDVTNTIDKAKAVRTLATILADKEGRRFILRLEREDAELCIEILDRAMALDSLGIAEKQIFFVTLRRLAQHHGRLPDSMMLTERIEVSDQIIAPGGFADVRTEVFKGRVVAVKTTRVTERDNFPKIKKFCKEILLWNPPSHPNVLGFLGVQVDMEKGRFVTVSEWMEHGNIMEYIKKNAANRLELLHGAAQGLEYLHGANITHGDLKSANILISNSTPPRACLTDFGFMTMVLDPGQPMSCSVGLEGGTLGFMSPELSIPSKFGTEDSIPTPEGDIYAFSSVIFQVLTGETPFRDVRHMELGYAVVEGLRPKKPENASAIGFSDSLWGFVQRCWDCDMKLRPKVAEVVKQLEKEATDWKGLMPPSARAHNVSSNSTEVMPDSMQHNDIFQSSSGVVLGNPTEESQEVPHRVPQPEPQVHTRLQLREPHNGLTGLYLDSSSMRTPNQISLRFNTAQPPTSPPHIRERRGGLGPPVELSPPPAPLLTPVKCFSREEFVNDVLDLTDQVASTALFGSIGVGKSFVAHTLLHHDRTKSKFGNNRHFMSCDSLTSSLDGFLERLSNVINADRTTNPEQLKSHLESSSPLILLLDGVDLILDPLAHESDEVSATIEELGSYPHVCVVTTSRMDPGIHGFHRVEVPIPSKDDARDTFHDLCNLERSPAVDDLIVKLDLHPLSIYLLAGSVRENNWDERMLLKALDDGETSVLKETYHKGLKDAVGLSLCSPTIRNLGATARNVLEGIAAYPDGVEERILENVFPGVTGVGATLDVLCKFFLAYREDGVVKMLSPFRFYFLDSALVPAQHGEIIRWGSDCNPARGCMSFSHDVLYGQGVTPFEVLPVYSDGPIFPCAKTPRRGASSRMDWIKRFESVKKRLLALFGRPGVPSVKVSIVAEEPSNTPPAAPAQQSPPVLTA